LVPALAPVEVTASPAIAIINAEPAHPLVLRLIKRK
jgi:hypothetical protein